VNVLLAPIGSGGDLAPFIAVGRALARRGHRAVVLANPCFAEQVERAGLELTAYGDAEDYRALTANPDAIDPLRGFYAVMDYVTRTIEPLQRAITAEAARAAQQGSAPTVIVGHALAFGARIAEEKLGLAGATLHLSPAALPSAHQPPVMNGVFNPSWMPRWYKRSAWWAIDRLVIDRAVGRPVNAARRAAGLPELVRLFEHGWDSPHRFLGLFPEWFAPVQPDWPSNLELVGFPLDDAAAPLAPDEQAQLDAFLDGGSPPLVFTPGSGNRHAHGFFEAAIDASARLGRRALLLTRFADQVPERLPEHVRHFAFVPLQTLLPRAAAIAHHGGIGTAAEALGAGVPQLVLPFSHDQPDNAARLERLGVSRTIPWRRASGPAMSAALGKLLSSLEVARACHAWRRRAHAGDALESTCDALESLTARAPARRLRGER